MMTIRVFPRPLSVRFGLFIWGAAALLSVAPVRAQDDAYEPNNATNEATDLSASPGIWLSDNLGLGIQCDSDWYKIAVPAGLERVTVDCLSSAARGNITIALYDSNAVRLAWSDSWEDRDGLEFVVPTNGTYYVLVYGANRCNAYNLQWDRQSPAGGADDAYETNDTASGAFDLKARRGTPLSLIAGLGRQCDPDWYRIYVAPGSERLMAQCVYTNDPGAFGLELRNEMGQQVALAAPPMDRSTLDLRVPVAGTYYLQVPGGAACQEYDLWWTCAIPPNRAGPPVVVALFFNENFVDTSTLTEGEAYNVWKALEAMSVRVNTFTGITEAAFSLALGGANVLLIPELEGGHLASSLDPATLAILRGFVAGGGCLVIHGQYLGNDAAFVNAVFGWSVQPQGDHSDATSTNNPGATAGTAFEEGPPSLGGENGLYPWLAASLPPGSSSLYQFESGGDADTTVAVIPYGAGRAVFLAWDWYNGAPVGMQDKGWNGILLSALAQCSCEPLLTAERRSGPDTLVWLDGGFKHTYDIMYTDEDLKGSPAWTPFGILGSRIVTAPLEDFSFTDDYTALTSGGPSATGRRAYRVMRHPAVTAPEVAILLDANYVDMTWGAIPDAEGPNLVAALQRMRYGISSIAGITAQDFANALRPGGFLLIPELERGNLGADLSAGARAAISNFVQAGGTMIVHADIGASDENLVNTLFGFGLAGIGDMSYMDTTSTAAVAGTEYERCPATLPGIDGLYPWIPGTLPPGASVLYETPANGTNYPSVVVIPQGLGRVVLLAWDWWRAAPLGRQDGGWNEALDSTFRNWSDKNLFVGYYDLQAGQGVVPQHEPIETAGHTGVCLFDLAAEDLAGIDVLFAQNPANAGYAEEFTNRLDAIRQAVMGGMTLVFHDRATTNLTAQMLPGGQGIGFTRDMSLPLANDIQILTAGTFVTDGPGGVLNNGSLDNGNASSHGYADEATLPAGAVRILSRGAATEVVTFAYPCGAGWVVYSSIPLDFFLGGGSTNFREIYAPNVVEYGGWLP
ncbi:MAG TPA: PPC domain-containing protein [Kiritimatiellia bacterium]|nr:PPC domain-containing protein [Kiritimatiellia bacterium]HRZ10831.1 PPC domain-containing protein [Kiritimatiellia bacterium]HSA18896.1 PPC domain-containing protein [Kiritimatiellia bacterium]